QPIPNSAALFPRALAGFVLLVTLALIVILAVRWYPLSDPYVQSVVSLEGHSEQGYRIFQINCAGCHGAEGRGNVGPSLESVIHRRSQVGVIKQVIGGKTPPMPKFQPDPETMADLLAYLKQL
ncbi:MAG: cytochrome c, partial [Cyanobacteria bacterium P01_H01_bin.15]